MKVLQTGHPLTLIAGTPWLLDQRGILSVSQIFSKLISTFFSITGTKIVISQKHEK